MPTRAGQSRPSCKGKGSLLASGKQHCRLVPNPVTLHISNRNPYICCQGNCHHIPRIHLALTLSHLPANGYVTIQIKRRRALWPLFLFFPFFATTFSFFFYNKPHMELFWHGVVCLDVSRVSNTTLVPKTPGITTQESCSCWCDWEGLTSHGLPPLPAATAAPHGVHMLSPAPTHHMDFHHCHRPPATHHCETHKLVQCELCHCSL